MKLFFTALGVLNPLGVLGRKSTGLVRDADWAGVGRGMHVRPCRSVGLMRSILPCLIRCCLGAGAQPQHNTGRSGYAPSSVGCVRRVVNTLRYHVCLAFRLYGPMLLLCGFVLCRLCLR